MRTFQKIIRWCAIAFAIFLIVSIAFGILSAVGVLAGISSRSSRTGGGTATYTPVDAQIQELVMDIGAADIEIRTGEQLAVETDNPYITMEEAIGKLILREESHIASLEHSSVTLYLPRDLVFDRVDLSTGAGVIRIQRLACGKLDLELGAGTAEIQSLEVTEDADIQGGAGQIRIFNGSMTNLSLKLGVGKCQLQSELTGKIDLEAGIGELNLTVFGNRNDYTISVERGLGSIRIDGTDYGNTTIGSGANRIDVEGGIGSITMEFAPLE